MKKQGFIENNSVLNAIQAALGMIFDEESPIEDFILISLMRKLIVNHQRMGHDSVEYFFI